MKIIKKEKKNNLLEKARNYLEKNVRQVVTVAAAFAVAGVLVNVSTWTFEANLLAGQKSAPFSGTIAPVKKVPNWVALSSTEWKLAYNQIPLDKFIDLPEYIPGQLSIPFSSLDLKNSTDKAIRNAQVTFSTPYMGNYKLDGVEYAGSHLAVDMKMPTGTPVYAIANGVVVKAANQPGGYGNHIVLRHDDVPSLNDPNVKTTYYSGYAHLNSYSVVEGDLVSKGQQIGESGSTGTATTPHLHFQIDNDKAPWHLYWPYTSKEAADAGLSFWDAVNAGLGKEKAIETTINPLVYVQKYRNYQSGSTSSTVTQPVTTPVETPVVTPVITPTETNTNDQLPPLEETPVVSDPVNVVTQPTVSITPAAVKPASFELKYEKTFQIGIAQTFKVIALDKDNNVIADYKPANDVYIKIENGSATLSTSYLNSSSFNNGIAEFSLTPTASYGVRISVTDGSITKTSEVIQETSFSDLDSNDDSYVAVNFLKDNDIVRGYPDGTFKPENAVSRVEALKFIYEGLNKEIASRFVLEFSDTDSKSWYGRYVASAQKDGVVKGYAGNLFKPANAVTRAEFIKMLLEASGYDVNSVVPQAKPFSDVELSSWYAKYITLAKEKNLLDTSSNKFFPNEPMPRGEVAQILYKSILMQVSGKRSYDKNIVVDLDDVSGFYKQI